MARMNSGGYGHRIIFHADDEFSLCWNFDVAIGRLRRPRHLRRETDRRGAERFAKKWDLEIPESTRGYGGRKSR